MFNTNVIGLIHLVSPMHPEPQVAANRCCTRLQTQLLVKRESLRQGSEVVTHALIRLQAKQLGAHHPARLGRGSRGIRRWLHLLCDQARLARIHGRHDEGARQHADSCDRDSAGYGRDLYVARYCAGIRGLISSRQPSPSPACAATRPPPRRSTRACSRSSPKMSPRTLSLLRRASRTCEFTAQSRARSRADALSSNMAEVFIMPVNQAGPTIVHRSS